jgi:cysteine desulfurase
MKKINLDYAAAAPLDQEVIEAMLPFYSEHYGNPSSGHGLGEEPKKVLRQARENVAILIGSEPKDIIFTASASEANNLAIKGFVRSNRKKGNHIIASSIEHFSVLNQLKTLQKEGFEITLLPVDRYGLVDPEQLKNAINEQTILVTIQTANPEIGTVQPIEKLAAVAREKDVPFHTDAAAAVGWIPLRTDKTEINMLTLAGDQFYGPKGSAALYVRRGTRLMPLIEGGIQERGLRAGTENVAAIAGMGEAARIAALSLEQRSSATEAIRDELKESLFSNVPHLSLNGHPRDRLPHNLNVTVEFVEGEALLMRLEMDGIYVSSGSSCSSQVLKSSHVLAAIGLPPEMAQGSLQLTLGKGSSSEDIPYITEHFTKVSSLLRNMSPLYHQFLKEGQQDASVQ